MRGNQSLIQAAEWLIPRLDTAAPTADTGLQIGQDDLLRVFYLPPGSDLKEVLMSVLHTTPIRKVYQRSSPLAVIVRSSSEQMALAAQLIPPYSNR
jgi:hypothetical protein